MKTGKKLKRVVRFRPAFDRRHPDPSKNYGIHGVELLMVVVGDKGAAQFLLYTGWDLPHVVKEFAAKPCSRSRYTGECECHRGPMPADLGYHRQTPSYDGQTEMAAKCEWTGGPCYYDGSGLNAERIFDLLVTEGDEAVWTALEDYYRETVA